MKGRVRIVAIAGLVALAGCGSSGPKVCNVRPSPDGKTLVYTPPGCENHLKGETLNIQTKP